MKFVYYKILFLKQFFYRGTLKYKSNIYLKKYQIIFIFILKFIKFVT
jgi:hypothetical protein